MAGSKGLGIPIPVKNNSSGSPGKEGKMNRRCASRIAVLSCLFYLVSSAIVGGADSIAQTTKMKVSTGAVTAEMAPLWIAQDAGYYQKYGLSVEIVTISAGLTATQAMLSGEVQVSSQGGLPVANADIAGADLVMAGSAMNSFPFFLMVRRDIQSAGALKGKKIGITRLGSAADMAARMALEKLKLLPDKDVAIIQAGGLGETFAAMEGGSIDGGILTAPGYFTAKKRGYFQLVDLLSGTAEVQHTGVATTKKYIQTNRSPLLGFLKAFTEGLHRYRKDKRFSMDVLAKYLSSRDEEVLSQTYDLYRPIFLEVPYPTAKGMQTIIDFLAQSNPRYKALRPEQLVDTSLVKELVDSGFIEELRKQR